MLSALTLAACHRGPPVSPRRDLSVDLAPPLIADDTGGRFHLLPGPRELRWTSVRGDCRIEMMPDGFIASWARFHHKLPNGREDDGLVLSARAHDGHPLWRVEGWGKAMAISSDGKRVIAADDRKQIAVFDARSGMLMHAPSQLDFWISELTWLLDRDQAVGGGARLSFFNGDGVPGGALAAVKGDGGKLQWLPAGEARPFGSQIAAAVAGLPDGRLLVAEGRAVLRIDAATGKEEARLAFDNAKALFLSRDRASVVVVGPRGFAIYDVKTSSRRFARDFPGKAGIRWPGMEPGSSRFWVPMPKLSPDNRHLIINDAAGQVWLLSGKDGSTLREYPRALLELVEDVHWLDDRTLVALLDDGHVVRFGIAGDKLDWKIMDSP